MNQLRCLGIIMDGNRRFAREQGLPAMAGHRRGFDKVKEVLDWARQAGIKTVFLYAFSTENWQRAKAEVRYLLSLFKKMLADELEELKQKGVRLKFLGDRSRFPPPLQKVMMEAERQTAVNHKTTLVLALSYGGRPEIVQAAKVFARKYGRQRDADEKEFSQCLWTAGLPDPDLIIRTGGEQRLSNFLPWQSVYSELYFTKTYWPALTRQEFETIIADYRERQRRFGR